MEMLNLHSNRKTTDRKHHQMHHGIKRTSSLLSQLNLTEIAGKSRDKIQEVRIYNTENYVKT